MVCDQANHVPPVGMSMFALGVRVVTAAQQPRVVRLTYRESMHIVKR